MLEVTDSECFALCEHIFLQKIPELGKYWVFNTEGGEHYSLNETSYWVLEQIGDGMKAGEILSAFLSRYDVDGEQGQKDFMEILTLFLKEGIIERRECDEGQREEGL